ncbi:hypothetical protein STEG23_036202, partial [Scotinomys teguina]
MALKGDTPGTRDQDESDLGRVDAIIHVQLKKPKAQGFTWFRGFILLLTFFVYACYHMSRKPISIVKSRLHQNCSELVRPENDTHDPNDTTWCSWSPFDKDDYKELLGAVDNAFLVAYAIGMFISGIFGERLPLRYYLSAGMVLSGLFTSLFGLGYFWNIHMLWYFVLIQARIHHGHLEFPHFCGQHPGLLIAGVWVNQQWGLSFIVPGIITAIMGIITFLFLLNVSGPFPPHALRVTRRRNETTLRILRMVPIPTGKVMWTLQSAPPRNRALSLQPSVSGSTQNSGVIEFSLCLLFAKLVSYTFLYWLPLYISNVAHFSAKEAGDLSTLFDVGGIIGGIMAGLISDYTNGRATTCCIMLILAAPMMFLYNYVGQNGIASSIAMLIICGLLVNGPYALITTAVSADLGTHESLKGNAKALSTVTAIIDGTGSIGAALGPLLAGLISPTGWNNVFYMLISADILACLLLCRLVYKEIVAWKMSQSRSSG